METCGGLTRYSRSARGRPCVRSSRSACATGTAASWLHAHAASVSSTAKSRFDFVSFKTKKLWGEPILRSQLQTVTEASCWPRSSISIVRNEVQSRLSTYSLRQLRLGFELQPPPLSDTTLAERLPLRVPGTTIYAQRSTTESSTHTDVVMVVVLRSRDAVCLRLASLA